MQEIIALIVVFLIVQTIVKFVLVYLFGWGLFFAVHKWTDRQTVLKQIDSEHARNLSALERQAFERSLALRLIWWPLFKNRAPSIVDREARNFGHH